MVPIRCYLPILWGGGGAYAKGAVASSSVVFAISL